MWATLENASLSSTFFVFLLYHDSFICMRRDRSFDLACRVTHRNYTLSPNSYSILNKGRQLLIEIFIFTSIRKKHCWAGESIIPWAKWMAYTRCNIHIPAIFTICICRSRIVHTVPQIVLVQHICKKIYYCW